MWRWMQLFAPACTALFCFMPLKSACAVETTTGQYQLEKAVMLMRHGVRSGFHPEKHERYSKKPWPDFGIPNGQLTAHGRDALVLWGAYHRTLLNQAGLFAADHVLSAADVLVESSPTQRTRDSADAFMSGFSPGFVMQPASAEAKRWFTPKDGGVAFPDPVAARAAAMEGLGMSLRAAQAHYRPAVLAVESALSIPEGQVADQPWQMAVGTHVQFKPLGDLEDMLETVRMQYANGMPLENVAFGNARDARAVTELMRIRTAFWQTVHLPRYLALQFYAPLFAALSHSLLEHPSVEHAGGESALFDSAERRTALPVPKLAVYVGHDSNIAPISAILGFQWQMPDGLPNDQQPGGFILFERLREMKTGERFVRVSYHAQTLDQIRFLTALGPASAATTVPSAALGISTGAPRGMPFRVDFEAPAAWGTRADRLIPIAQYRAMVRGVAEEALPGAHPITRIAVQP
jgi:4-phytase/acid phosphatase